MRIEVTNSRVTVSDTSPAEDGAMEALRDETSYMVEGARHSDAFQSGRWDGREYLMRRARGGKWHAPVGLLWEIQKLVAEDGFEADYVDRRRNVGRRLALNLATGFELRDYQKEASEAVRRDRGLQTGKGMLNLATRAGKTIIALDVIARLGHRTLFIVNSDELLQQTVKKFRELLWSEEPVPGGLPLVGQWGGGDQQIGWVTVASVQSLIRRFYDGPSDQRVREIKANAKRAGRKARIPQPPPPDVCASIDDLLRVSDVVFFDECHHLEAPEWRRAMQECDALYKVGLSATIFVDKERGTAKGTIWLIGSTGPILSRVSASELIRAGWLCRPVVNFVQAPHPRISTLPAHMKSDPPEIEGAWATIYKDGIVENAPRNKKIAMICQYEASRGHRVLVTLQQVKHVAPLSEALSELGLKYVAVTGKTSDRAAKIDRLRKREVQVLMGTIFKEAVDLPWLECVVIADGGASKVLTLQRLRNLTAVGEGDEPLGAVPSFPVQEVPVYDFVDDCSDVLRRHSLKRLQAYRGEDEFVVRWRKDL